MDRHVERESSRAFAFVFGGGNALGAYGAGAFEAFDRAGETPVWVAGSSVGAITAAIVAGNSAEHRVRRLREYWVRASLPSGPWDIPARPMHLLAALQSRLMGRPGVFVPALASLPAELRRDAALSDLGAAVEESGVELVRLQYLAGPEEFGMRWFDFSASAIERRWRTGAKDMRAALQDVADREQRRAPRAPR